MDVDSKRASGLFWQRKLSGNGDNYLLLLNEKFHYLFSSARHVTDWALWLAQILN